jgi:hypothetical protein
MCGGDCMSVFAWGSPAGYDAWKTTPDDIGFTDDEEHSLVDDDWYDEEKAERLREAMDRETD